MAHQLLNEKVIVAYYRVSTQKQGISGLGLEAQQGMVQRFIEKIPDYEFTDIESGKNNKRVNLNLALQKIKEIEGTGKKAILVIAKLDRLSRNINFITNLQNSKVEFICSDMPNANSFTIHLFGIIAEYEVKMISDRTKESLAVLKERGVKLGNPYKAGEIKKDGTIAGTPFGIDRNKSNETIRKNKLENEEYQKTLRIAKDLRCNGLNWREISNKLNEYGCKTYSGKKFTNNLAWQLFNRGKDKIIIPSQYEGEYIYENIDNNKSNKD